jgi:acetate---CoA ligase (ADP-forming)
VALYVEGFENGRAFLDTAARVTRFKPVVLLKGGRSEAGRAAARSHTGALASEYGTLRAALRQAGVIELQRSDELFPVAETLARQPAIRAGTGVAVLSDGGGHATLAADTLTAYGVPLARLSRDTERKLRGLLGPNASLANPIDVAGAADREPRVFLATLRLVAGDPAVGGVLMVGLFGGYAIRFAADLAEAELATAREMARAMSLSRKPLVVHSLYAAAPSPPLAALGEAAIPVIGSLEVGCRCIAAAWERGVIEARRPLPRPVPVRPKRAALAQARREQRETLLEPEARALLAHYGVPFAPAEFCRTAEEVAQSAVELGGPVAVKAVSAAISHKTEAGAVILGLQGPEAAVRAFQTVRKSVAAYARKRNLDAGLRGVLVVRMQAPPLHELLVGARRDPDFGPVVTVGAGGVSVEVLGDAALRVLPVRREDVAEMLA